LRPNAWLAAHSVAPGGRIVLQMEEMRVFGVARVLAVDRCPEVRPGRGRVVTGTISHLNGFVRQLTFGICSTKHTLTGQNAGSRTCSSSTTVD
jgi:hypothetical protein